MKNKKSIDIKKIIIIFIILGIIIAGGIISLNIKNKNDANGVFSVLEKRWIEKNKSTVVDVSILNDIPIFGYEGEGVFFDFLDDFSKDTGIEFNNLNNKAKLDDNELLMYTDNYVMISKESEKIKDFNKLDNVIIGVTESDLTLVKEYFENNDTVIYNTYNNVDSIVNALKNNDIKYAIIPNDINLDKIFSNNFYVVYNITDIYNTYVLKINGEENLLNSIFKKYYIRWMRDKYSSAYNERLFNLYFDKKEYDEIAKSNFKSKDYVY